MRVELEDDAGRPVALVVFAVLAALGFCVTVVLGVTGSDSPDRLEQPDPAVAASIEEELSALPGVESAAVVNSIDCVDDCSQTPREYSATVALSADVTAAQISEIVRVHDAVAPAKVGLDAVPISMLVAADKVLNVDSVHYGFGVTQADAYLAAIDADAGIEAAYGPPGAGESPLLTVAAVVSEPACDGADAAMAQVVPAVSAAAAAGGIPFGTVQLSCGPQSAVALEAGIAAGAQYHAGWTEAATSIDRLCSQQTCGDEIGGLHDVYVDFVDSSTVVTVHLNDHQSLAAEDLATLHGVVDALSEAGAANPQLDLQNY